ncbi:uncharacterized protein CcaverHIS019_0210700 [Cutaneotrichosporon cavernicola]|uniref:Zn(2)-C6 fungal-type domain-containing protein n=1 Tax=Cutaneotrichosporon cavernicola TaxID=279322 RepID=A0AA48L2N4_9TREE|nr:uncharacterized protein CcaverHIS019_0210700 [Cutaneotrichosporon cavernicola]BEI89708.1 hypothetical protein CcaverHIS019_0210700 [Cutaneotrichosporon cavernicola]BEI97479.1 hypothetical protein CcaverHIS631_0210680 [Cutaneotrichosporon cavernicola]BEJ05257.1 hypothetical protein CcaverHIS641_0210740 [Cutaneotrichosporon cavernicola]
MRLSHPPSRLSPLPGVSMHELMAGARESAPLPPKRKDEDRTPKRGYRACVHCRLRKAKCDLGDVNAPSEPPCTRCRREQRNCVFLPSKRRRKNGDEEAKPEVYPAHGGSMGLGTSANGAGESTHSHGASIHQSHAGSGTHPTPTHLTEPGSSTHPTHTGSSSQAPHIHRQPQMPGDELRPWHETMGLGGFEKASPYVDPPTNTTSSSFGSTSTTSPNNPTGSRRRREPDATRRIVVASFNNETDALEILAKAATDADGDGSTEEKESALERKRVSWADDAHRQNLDEFVLVRRGVLDEHRLELLVQVFFRHHHPVLPIFQTVRIPHNKTQLAALAQDDPFLLSAIVCVASRHHAAPGMKEVHEKTYALVRDVLADYACAGWQPSIGFIEGVLILAENLPRERQSPTSAEFSGPAMEGPQGLHGLENRRAWALTGTAIRAAYGLGLDQLALEDSERNADLERARGVWTWCYLYDRTLGLRTGLAFWSRGPTLCFQGYSDISQTGEAAARVNFPYMMQGEVVDANDSASLMQASLELTQIMTNAHDILYSTPTRTKNLVRKGEYFKYLDHFRRALDSFTVAWKDKEWRLESTRELTWCTFHFVRLYVAAFAFQAHVQRAQERADAARESPRPNGVGSIFPRGSATSPDALFIYDSIDAASEILHICIRLGDRGVIQYLPSRYLINFAYSGTFALKAAYSGATGKGEMVKTTELVERVCAALLHASPDKDHPASRFGRMLSLLARRLTELGSAVPSRFPSPEPQPVEKPVEMPDPGLFGLDQGALFEDMGVGFNLDGFWEDFTLTDSGGFPFR